MKNFIEKEIKVVIKELEKTKDTLFWYMYDNELDEDRFIRGKLEGLSESILHIKIGLGIVDATKEESVGNGD